MTAAFQPLTPTYADHGVVWAYRFNSHGTATPVPIDAVMAAGEPGEGFEWVHLNLADARSQGWIRTTPELPERAKAILLAVDAHHCIDHDGAFVWGIFSDVLHDSAGSADAQLGHLHFAFGDRLLVSGRRRPLTSVEKARVLIEQGVRVPAPVALLETLVQHVVAAIAEVVTTLTREFDVIEDHTLSEEIRDERRLLMPFRRTALRLHRQLCGLSTIFRRFEAVEPDDLPIDLTGTAARLAQRIDALTHEVHAIQERARLLQDEISQKLAAQTNRHLYVLSVLTTLLLPPTLVTGFFGMNSKGLPFAESEAGTAIAAGLCVVAAAAVYFLMRCRGMFDRALPISASGRR